LIPVVASLPVSGHGNIDRPEAEALIDVGELSAGPLDQPQQTAGKQKGASDFLRDYLDEQMTYQLMGQIVTEATCYQLP
jgi:hypothetical protein